ncbi:hypothetical protein HQ529_02095, partial [Candidatus Woesearchaeota archaeon]|nr:hypothetical protein [Candidatus Woesearchaeota archaeon]
SFITGTKLSELKTTKKGFSKKILAKNIVDSILTQVFIHGVFHADPHPGNILALKNNKVAFLDFGIVGHFDDELKDKITELFVAMISGNLEEIAESFTDIGIVGEETDIEEFKEDLYNNMEKYYDTSLDEINISSLFGDLLFLAKKYNMHMPSDLILLSKTIITTEGTALGLDPDFNFVEIGKPFVKSLVKSRVHPKEIMKKVVRTTHNLKRFIEKFPKQTNELIKRIKQGDKGIENIDRDLQVLAREMDRSSNRVALGLLITAFLISSAMIMGVEQKMIYGFPLYSSVGFLIGIMLLIMLLLSFMREKAR